MPPPEPLAATQSRFWRLITAPRGVREALRTDPEAAAVPIESWVAAHDAEAAAARLDVYANMYFFRIKDVLAEDFERTASIAGAARFHNLITDFLLAHPPIEPTLRHVGRELPAFIASHEVSARWPYLADLARVEQGRLTVFDAADAEPMTAADLDTLAPDAWVDLPIHTIPSLTVLELEFPSHQLWAVTPVTPGETPPPDPGRKATRLLVWRSGFRVWHRPLEGAETTALEAARRGATFAEICEIVAGNDDDILRAARAAHSTLLGWIAEGLIARVRSEQHS